MRLSVKNSGSRVRRFHQIRKLYGIPSSIADNPERNEKIIALYKKGMSGTAIAKKFDLSISQAYRIINDAGAGKNKPAKKAAKTVAKKKGRK